MTYKVSVSTNSYSVKLSTTPKFKVLQTLGEAVANLSDLLDVDVSNVNDKYVLMYDASTQKYKMVNPDDVLSASVTEPISPGIPTDFVDEIDLDAGTF